MFVEAIQRHSNVWELYCQDCAESIGTLTGVGMRGALIFGMSAGGVKCPTCRINSCPRCFYKGLNGKLCTLCEMESTMNKN